MKKSALSVCVAKCSCTSSPFCRWPTAMADGRTHFYCGCRCGRMVQGYRGCTMHMQSVKLTIFFRSHPIDNLHIQIGILHRQHVRFDLVSVVSHNKFSNCVVLGSRWFALSFVGFCVLSLTILSFLLSHDLSLYLSEWRRRRIIQMRRRWRQWWRLWTHKCTRAQRNRPNIILHSRNRKMAICLVEINSSHASCAMAHTQTVLDADAVVPNINHFVRFAHASKCTNW